MKNGINLARQKLYEFSVNEQKDLENKKCVFLSHRSVDKDKVIKIGNYIMKAGLNIYLDVNDANLQDAVNAQNAKKITQCIQRGLSYSHYVLCAISSNTFDDKSWWVPYEIGYADKELKECCLLKLDTLSRNNIPDYLKIKEILYNVGNLNKKLQTWSTTILKEWSVMDDYSIYNGILSESVTSHVLTGAMDRII